MRVPPVIALAPALAAAACGDSLLTGAQAERLLGNTPPPSRPAWMQLWVDDDLTGAVVSCDLQPISADLRRQVREQPTATRLDVPPPQPVEPPVWSGEETFRGETWWAVSLHLLVDEGRIAQEASAELFLTDVEEAILEGRDGFSHIETVPGLWGVADTTARLYVEGDPEVVGDQVIAGAVPPDLNDDGIAWVGFAQEVVHAVGSFEGALTALDPEDQQALNRQGLPVRRIDAVDDATLKVVSGLSFGGMDLALDCIEFFPEYFDPEDFDARESREDDLYDGIFDNSTPSPAPDSATDSNNCAPDHPPGALHTPPLLEAHVDD